MNGIDESVFETQLDIELEVIGDMYYYHYKSRYCW